MGPLGRSSRTGNPSLATRFGGPRTGHHSNWAAHPWSEGWRPEPPPAAGEDPQLDAGGVALLIQDRSDPTHCHPGVARAALLLLCGADFSLSHMGAEQIWWVVLAPARGWTAACGSR